MFTGGSFEYELAFAWYHALYFSFNLYAVPQLLNSIHEDLRKHGGEAGPEDQSIYKTFTLLISLIQGLASVR